MALDDSNLVSGWRELIEALAEKEHASWSRWMAYLFSKCDRLPDGGYVIDISLANHWIRQARTPYAELTEKEKESDRKEVYEILPLIAHLQCDAVVGRALRIAPAWCQVRIDDRPDSSQNEPGSVYPAPPDGF